MWHKFHVGFLFEQRFIPQVLFERLFNFGGHLPGRGVCLSIFHFPNPCTAFEFDRRFALSRPDGVVRGVRWP